MNTFFDAPFLLKIAQAAWQKAHFAMFGHLDQGELS